MGELRILHEMRGVLVSVGVDQAADLSRIEEASGLHLETLVEAPGIFGLWVFWYDFGLWVPRWIRLPPLDLERFGSRTAKT